MVQRRIGGLEKAAKELDALLAVQRRIGGLESGSIKIRKHEPVQRRIGGLVVLLNKLKN